MKHLGDVDENIFALSIDRCGKFLEFFMVPKSELVGPKIEIISSFLDTKSIEVAQKEAIESLFGRYSWEVQNMRSSNSSNYIQVKIWTRRQ
jgi:hypothetical protein